jgi:diguanylate cyclase (GGDEF)-like protein/PAS domain S-box-containing protein
MTPKKKLALQPEIPKAKKKVRAAVKDVPQSAFPIVDIGASVDGLELSESEKRYRLFQGILRSTSDGILVVNRKNEVLLANDSFVELWRIPQEIMASKDDTLLLQYVLDQLSDPQGFLQKVEELYNSSEESFDILYFKDGRVFDRLSRPLIQETKFIGRVWSFRDITERKRADEALRESEERHRSLFDRMLDGVYRSTHAGKFVDVNPAMVRMFGYSSKAEMLEVDIKKELYFAPEERGSHILDTGREEMDVYRMRRKDGSEIWVEDHGFYVHDQQGRIIYHEGMLREITERVQAEALRAVLLEIMQGGVTTKDLQDFLGLVHRSIDKVIYAENFFVTLYNKDADWFEEVYSADKFDPPGPPSRNGKSISAYVIRSGRPMLLNDERIFSELVAQGEVELVGTNSPSWMGVPLKTSRETIGVMVVQDYEVPNRYSERDLEVFASIAGQVALVVERKWAEEALATSEAELRALFASMHDAVLVIDREGVYRKIAPTNPGLLVKPPEELLGKNLTDFFPAEQAEAFRGIVQRVLDTKQNAQIEYELIIAGQSVWFQTTISPLNADSTLWVAHDITDRKQAERALNTSEARYRTLIEQIPAIVYIDDATGTPGHSLYISPQIETLLGITPDEWLQENLDLWVNHIHPDDRTRAKAEYLRGFQSGEKINCEYRMITTDGRLVWIRDQTMTIHDGDGRPSLIHGVMYDITQRKWAEEELRRAKDELETANLNLQRSLEREQSLARTDGLTCLYNYRHFFELASREFSAAVRHKRPLAFIMFDVDGFKRINDSFGHLTGDKALALVAQIAGAQMRASDVLARYGGDEFIILLPQTSAQQALSIAERIHASTAAARLETEKGDLFLTLSIGIAELNHALLNETLEAVIRCADKAMYAAKQAGRNRSVIFGQDETGAT